VKVLLFSNHYPAADAPTRGTYNHAIWQLLAKSCEVRVVGPVAWWRRAKSPRSMIAPHRDTAFGLQACFPSYWSIPGVTPLHGHATFVSALPLLLRMRRAFPFDVVVGSNAYPDGVGAADVAALAGVPLVQSVIGTDVNELPTRRALRPQIRWALRRARRVVAVSRAMAERVVALGVPRARVVYRHNGVDGELFAPRSRAEARRRVGLDHSGPVVLYVGNVTLAKGAGVLVEAMARLAAEHGRGDVLAVIVGSGAADAEIASRVRGLGLERSVRIVGRRPHSEIATWMCACDVLCLPSFDEGCPNVVLEALASGRPVVASRVGGIPELIEDGDNGLLVPARDAGALADALGAALRREWDPRTLRATVAELSHEPLASAYRAMLEEVLDEHAAAAARGARLGA
jgi:glycosyltransferase involved in cell wall biosynthesis